MAYSSFEALWGKKNQGIEMTEEQQDEPDSPSTQFDLTPHDDSVNEVLKELSDRIVAMEKRLQELEKMGKNLCTERMEGEINTETERTFTTTCDNDQSTSCDVVSRR